MNIEQPSSDFFTAGGTLPPDAPSYVKRPTDDELFQHIMAGEFCYVLTPRQMGKSSLMIRTAQRLQKEGIRSAIVDLTVTGTVESEDQWYKGILTQIKRRLRISIDPVQWWEQRKDIPNIQKFVEFFEEVLTELKERVVIFMDEIDTTLKLDFRDDFFAGIRAIFNARAENPDLKRLTFVLLGVASPSDLIKDRNRTPFNIGQEIPLRPFSRENARMLEAGLEETYPNHGKKILDRIFYWTNGHPYLTQKLCQSVVETRLKVYDDKEIDLLVKNLFTSEESSRETNLQFVRDNVLNYPERRAILSLYKKLLRGAEIRDNKNSLPQNHLKLSGLARAEDGKLVVSNKIYSRVFDQKWINRYTEVDWRYFTIIAMSLVIISFASVFYNDGVRLPNQAATRVNGIPIYRDDRGIQYLADLFRMKPFIFANEYEYKAKDTFFNGFSSWEDQKNLIEITYREAPPPTEDYKLVITGLYTSLADVDRTGQTTKLLEVMQASLKEMKLQDENLYKEITHWIVARNEASNDLIGSLAEYILAINLNPQNPATRFERARIYVQLERYEEALKDYEQVIAIVPESNIEPTEISSPIPSNIPTEMLTSVFSPIPSVTLTNTPRGTITAIALTQALSTSESLLTPTPSFESTSLPTSTATVIPPPIQSRFLTLGQRISAVNNDILDNENLSAFLGLINPADYPNLEARGMFLLVTPTGPVPQLTGQAEPTGIALVTPTGSVPQLTGQAELTAFESGVQVFRGGGLAIDVQQDETTNVQVGDRIELGEQGRSILTFPDLLDIELFRNTKVLITAINQGPDNTINVTLTLSQGHIFAYLSNQTSSQITVETPSFTVTTLEDGTEFDVASDGQLGDVLVKKGSVELIAQGSKEIIRAGEAAGGFPPSLATETQTSGPISTASFTDFGATYLPSQTDVFSPGCFLISHARVFTQFTRAQAGISASLISGGRTGNGLRLDFSNVQEEGENYAGWEVWLGVDDLSGIDLSSYSSLVFYIRGKDGGEEPNIYLMVPVIGETFRRFWRDIEIVSPVSTSWKKVEIPLSDFTLGQLPDQQVDLENIQRIQILFEWYPQPRSGSIFVDDLCVR